LNPLSNPGSYSNSPAPSNSNAPRQTPAPTAPTNVSGNVSSNVSGNSAAAQPVADAQKKTGFLRSLYGAARRGLAPGAAKDAQRKE
jgi:hypothetical protein